MSIICNHSRQTAKTLGNLLKNPICLSRDYAVTVADYKINWLRPKKVSSLLPEKSGDQGIEVNIQQTDFRNAYAQSPELHDASDIVKKMFTYRFLPRKLMDNSKKQQISQSVNRHHSDSGSMEVRIARMTSDILRLQNYLKEHPRDGTAKVCLNETIMQRKKHLKNLRLWDYRCFEWLLEKLNLLYFPMPEQPLHITRKDSLRRLTEKHCNKLKQGKLNAYKKELQDLRKSFYQEKADKLAFIRKEEMLCGLPPTVNEEDILEATRKAKEHQT